MPDFMDSNNLTIDNEINFLHSIRGYNPIGINRNFHMMACVAKFTAFTSQEIHCSDIWGYLKSLYNLDILDNLAFSKLSFPNNITDFDPIEDNPELKVLLEKNESSSSNRSAAKESNKTDIVQIKSDISDDSTLSGSSTPVTTVSTSTPSTTTMKSKNKRQMGAGNETPNSLIRTAVEKIESGRKRDRSDSEKTDRLETRHTPSRQREETKSDKTSVEKHLSSTQTPSSKRDRSETDRDITPGSSTKKGSSRTNNPMVKKLRGYSPAVREAHTKSSSTTSTPSSNKKKNTK